MPRLPRPPGSSGLASESPHGRWRPREERSLPRPTCPINNDSCGRQGRPRLPASQDNLCPPQGRDHRGSCLNGLLIFPTSLHHSALHSLCSYCPVLFCSVLQCFLFIAVQFLDFLFLPVLCSHPPFIWLTCPQHPGEFMGSATSYVSPQALLHSVCLLFVHLSAFQFKSKLMRAKPCLT